jgi:hypothetical protein
MSDLSNANPAMAPASGKRRFVRNTLFSIGQSGIAMALALLLVPFLLWRLGTEKYGLWLTLQVFSILGLVSLAELGCKAPSFVIWCGIIRRGTSLPLDGFS